MNDDFTYDSITVEPNPAGWVGVAFDPSETNYRDASVAKARVKDESRHVLRGLKPYETALITVIADDRKETRRVVANDSGNIWVTLPSIRQRYDHELGWSVKPKEGEPAVEIDAANVRVE